MLFVLNRQQPLIFSTEKRQSEVEVGIEAIHVYPKEHE